MALKTMIKRITDAKKRYDAERAKLGKNVKKEIAKYLGAVVPEGFFLEWDQYTPYFNDGEPCTFSVNTPWLKSVKPMPETLVADESHDADEDDAAEEPTEDGEVAGPDDVFDAESEEDADDADDAEDEDIEHEDDDEEREWGEYEEDAGTFGLDSPAWIKVAACRAAGLTKKQVVDVYKAWNEIPEDVLETAFGDHVAIRVYADGSFRCDDCEHE